MCLLWCENVVFFCVKKSGISAFLVSAENGAGGDKMTNVTYVRALTLFMIALQFLTKDHRFYDFQKEVKIIVP